METVERRISHVFDPLPGRETQGRRRQMPRVQGGHQTAPPPGGLLAWSPIYCLFVSVLLTQVGLESHVAGKGNACPWEPSVLGAVWPAVVLTAALQAQCYQAHWTHGETGFAKGGAASDWPDSPVSRGPRATFLLYGV